MLAYVIRLRIENAYFVISSKNNAYLQGEHMPEHVILHDIKEAATRLNVSPWTIRNWITARKLACVHLGRLIRVPESELRRLVEDGTIPAQEK